MRAPPAALRAVHNPKLFRYLFWALWFVLVPLALAGLTIWLLTPADVDPTATGFDRIR